MKKADLLMVIGFIVYVVLSCIDRFIMTIPDIVYIPVMIVDIAIIFTGMILRKKKESN